MVSQPDTPRDRGHSDAPHASPVTPSEDARTILINRVAWGAVVAGVVLSLVTQLILNLFGIGIGLATLDPGTADNPSPEAFSAGAAIWWALSGIIAAGIGGYAAGRLAGQPKPASAAWHGLTSWAVATLVVALLLTSAVGGVLGGAMNSVSGARAAAVYHDGAEAMADPAGSADRGRAEAADRAVDVASSAALASAIALLLGALAAWFGGRAGAVEPTITSSPLASGRRTDL